jgi:hypothetical protein
MMTKPTVEYHIEFYPNNTMGSRWQCQAKINDVHTGKQKWVTVVEGNTPELVLSAAKDALIALLACELD